MLLSIFLLFLYYVGNTASRTLPSFVHRCRKSDPNLNNCISKSAMEVLEKVKYGNNVLGFVNLEPLFIKKIDVGNHTAGSFSLSPIFENIYLHGTTNATISDVDANLSGDNCSVDWNSFQPMFRLLSDYRMTGHVLFIPINGHGKGNNTLYDVHGHYRIDCKRYKKRNRTYLRITHFGIEMKPKKIIFGFDNIIDGNEQISKEILKTVNENADDLYADIAPSLNQAMGTVWASVIDQMFSRFSEDELLLP